MKRWLSAGDIGLGKCQLTHFQDLWLQSGCCSNQFALWWCGRGHRVCYQRPQVFSADKDIKLAFSRCKGDELHLLHCPHTALRSCGIAEVAGVTCIQNEGDKLTGLIICSYIYIICATFIMESPKSCIKDNKVII